MREHRAYLESLGQLDKSAHRAHRACLATMEPWVQMAHRACRATSDWRVQQAQWGLPVPSLGRRASLVHRARQSLALQARAEQTLPHTSTWTTGRATR